MRRSLTPFAITCILSSALSAQTFPSAVPTYKFTPGQRVTYTGSSKFTYTNGSFEDTLSHQIIVLAINADGSYRLLIRSKTTDIQKRDGDTAKPQPPAEDISYSQVDMRPDGSTIETAAHSPRDAKLMLPHLPTRTTELQTGWQQDSNAGDSTQLFHSASSDQNGKWTFTSTTEGTLKKIYGITSDCTYQFDTTAGRLISIDTRDKQDYGFKGAGTGSYTFEKTETIPADQIAALTKDWGTLSADKTLIRDTMKSIEKAPDQADTLANTARAHLTADTATVTTPELKAQLEQMASQIDEQVKYTRESAEQIAQVVGKPAPDFSATDLAGKPHKLSDYKGKVVLLDFWYRGCGWCIKSMPQMKQIATDFKDKPVTILGLNTDTNVADARFVVDAMGLNYDTLQITFDTANKLNVHGFPSLLILDANGIVREFHVGYSPTLRADIGGKIQGILDSGTK